LELTPEPPWAEVPVFGERETGRAYIVRPSAYAIFCNGRGELGVVIAPGGAFLPGGGIVPAETVEQAVIREVREECGLIVRAGEEVGRAIELVHSSREQRHFEKRSIFLLATAEGVAGSPSEADHQLEWLSPAVAVTKMAHRSHAWAVEQWASVR